MVDHLQVVEKIGVLPQQASYLIKFYNAKKNLQQHKEQQRKAQTFLQQGKQQGKL
jgi:hypothetical protein